MDNCFPIIPMEVVPKPVGRFRCFVTHLQLASDPLSTCMETWYVATGSNKVAILFSNLPWKAWDLLQSKVQNCPVAVGHKQLGFYQDQTRCDVGILCVALLRSFKKASHGGDMGWRCRGHGMGGRAGRGPPSFCITTPIQIPSPSLQSGVARQWTHLKP